MWRRLRRCGSSMTTLRRCWPRWSSRSPRRRLSLSPPTWRRLRRCGSSMTTLRHCWPRWSWRSPRRRLSLSPPTSMVVALATPKTLTEPTDVAATAPMWE
ncbi:hypothetical protein PF004_g30931 [Phytophthora fragariae]|uniref:Uncharacterized protein n=1 Tax=Phytophthora fragariae TaxID=53985 RepID=A0A6G0MAV0_9STRA|nr:hypothetical protein PF004_g30931 [Phytophthora fragariae]